MESQSMWRCRYTKDRLTLPILCRPAVTTLYPTYQKKNFQLDRFLKNCRKETEDRQESQDEINNGRSKLSMACSNSNCLPMPLHPSFRIRNMMKFQM